MNARAAGRGGFSLVEVVLALGVVVFCLIAMLGLLAVGTSTTKSSIEETRVTNILGAIDTDLEAARSTATNSSIYGIQFPAAGSSAGTQTTVSLDENGQVIASGSTNAPRYLLNAYAAQPASHPETVVRLVISWPAAAPVTNAPGRVETVVALNRAP